MRHILQANTYSSLSTNILCILILKGKNSETSLNIQLQPKRQGCTLKIFSLLGLFDGATQLHCKALLGSIKNHVGFWMQSKSSLTLMKTE